MGVRLLKSWPVRHGRRMWAGTMCPSSPSLCSCHPRSPRVTGILTELKFLDQVCGLCGVHVHVSTDGGREGERGRGVGT